MLLVIYHAKASESSAGRIAVPRPESVGARLVLDAKSLALVVWPQEDGEPTAHFRWLAHTHAMRWHVAHGTVGRGHLSQGRFRCFPVEGDEHFFTVGRYVERNAWTAGVVGRAEDWRWGRLWARRRGGEPWQTLLGDWPLPRPADWLNLVNPSVADVSR